MSISYDEIIISLVSAIHREVDNHNLSNVDDLEDFIKTLT